jgi:hypothetical protein
MAWIVAGSESTRTYSAPEETARELRAFFATSSG